MTNNTKTDAQKMVGRLTEARQYFADRQENPGDFFGRELSNFKASGRERGTDLHARTLVAANYADRDRNSRTAEATRLAKEHDYICMTYEDDRQRADYAAKGIGCPPKTPGKTDWAFD